MQIFSHRCMQMLIIMVTIMHANIELTRLDLLAVFDHVLNAVVQVAQNPRLALRHCMCEYNRQGDIQAYRHTDRRTERLTHRQTRTHKPTHEHRQSHKQTDAHAHAHEHRHKDRHTHQSEHGTVSLPPRNPNL